MQNFNLLLCNQVYQSFRLMLLNFESIKEVIIFVFQYCYSVTLTTLVKKSIILPTNAAFDLYKISIGHVIDVWIFCSAHLPMSQSFSIAQTQIAQNSLIPDRTILHPLLIFLFQDSLGFLVDFMYQMNFTVKLSNSNNENKSLTIFFASHF